MNKTQLDDNKYSKKRTALIIILISIIFTWFFSTLIYITMRNVPYKHASPSTRLFDVQSIDTMKFSRDLARTELKNDSFDQVIDTQIKLIKGAHATHVAIDTPYDDEFTPMLSRWVVAARKNDLLVWFRGNFSGWEGWFGYQKINTNEHARLLKLFIEKNRDLFQDGDIFSPCPECENGGPGDPRQTQQKGAYNNFLINEYEISMSAFRAINKKVTIYPSMNGDVAKEIITPEISKRLGGVVLIDHYDKSASHFAQVIKEVSSTTGALIGLGEFGAPIVDINGNMSEEDQAHFIREIFETITDPKNNVSVVNYWTLSGGSTALTRNDNTLKPAYSVVSSFFSPIQVKGNVIDPVGNRIPDVTITLLGTRENTKSSGTGSYFLLVPDLYTTLHFEKDGYASTSMTIDGKSQIVTQNVTLNPTSPSFWYAVKLFLLKKATP